MGYRHCPVCWKTVVPTQGDKICDHFTSHPSVRETCPASGYPHRIAIRYKMMVKGRRKKAA